MRIAFAGTPPFAAAALSALLAAGHDIVLVLTQPDRPSGRGLKLKASAVKEVALRHALPVLCPSSLSVNKNPEQAAPAIAALEQCQADVLIVAAYGLILPLRVLNAARGIGAAGDIKSINLHASILPRWRGAAPIQRAIESGDAGTGVTLMKMELGLDTGAAIETVTTDITDQDTTATLTDRLAELGAQALIKALERADTLTYTPQIESQATYASKITKTESAIDWSLPARQIAQKIRAFNPFPSCSALSEQTPFKIWFAQPCDGAGKPGEILECKKRLVIACGEGAIDCLRLQKPGKPAMDALPFLQSAGFVQGEILK